jgi:serine/threonine protein kinase/Tol biopolymer transport system component
MSLAPASKVGPYLVERLIGCGGMGEVYLGRDPRLDRAVALKIVPADKNWDETRRARLLKEARTVSSLHHPNIVVIYDIVHENGADVVVMEYVQGKTFDELIPRRGLRLSEALQYAIPIADGLAAAHRAGVIHRDLKPANVIVDESGTVKLLDFGLAKTVALVAPEDNDTRSIGATLTAEGTIVGTVSYMSPEQAEGKAVDARTDIFSFGCVLYEMVTGRKAFERDSRAATLSAILREEPRPASESSNRIPREMDRIIGKCLRKNPERRWQSMADVRGLLQDLKEDSESGALDAVDTRPALARRRYKLWAGVALGAFCTIFAIAGLWWMRRSNTETALVPVPLTSYPGSEYDPAFSPDGNQVAFVWDGEDRTTPHIYLKLVGATDALRLTKDPRPERYPAWSRDGRSIAFNRRAENGRANIIITSALGGAEYKIGELQACCSRLSWSPDAKWLVTGEHFESNLGRLLLLNVETGEKRVVLSTPAGAYGDYDPAFSPSGRAIAFARSSGTKNDIFVVPLSEDMKPSGPASPVTMDGAWNGEPAWTPDGREIVYASGLAGYLAGDLWTTYSRLWRVGLSGHSKPRQLAFAQDGSAQPSVAMSGYRMAYRVITSYSHIWRSPVGSGPAAPAIVAASTRGESSPSYSPDGSKIVFSSERTGISEVWVSNADGSNPQQLTRFGRGLSGSPQFSPDGKRIAFDSRSVTGPFEIYLMEADGGNPVQLTRMGVESAAPYWSHDGKRIYFVSFKTGQHEIWMIPAGGGEPVQITRNGGYAGCESPDGAELYYTKVYGGGPVWKMRLTGGPETKVVDNVQLRGFTCGKNALYYVRPAGGNKYEFMRVPYAGGTPELLGKAESVSLGFALSRDERWLAYAKDDINGADLMLVENFR